MTARPAPPPSASELMRLRERVELEFRRAELTERRLQGQVGPTADIVDVSEPWPARPGGRAAGSSPRREPLPDPAVWPAAGPDPRPLDPNPGWACSTLRGRVRRHIGVSVCGFSGARLRQIVDLVAAQQRQQRDFIPVFLTDQSDFAAFREHGFVFEYLPGSEQRARHGWIADWPAYAAERRRLIERKWNLAEVIVFGEVEFGR